jgi:hypothetical protein
MRLLERPSELWRQQVASELWRAPGKEAIDHLAPAHNFTIYNSTIYRFPCVG